MNVKEIPFEELVVQYEPLIKSQIKKLYTFEKYEELYQVALIALWEAQQKYDPTKKFFTSYAQLYVKGRLRNFVKREQSYRQRHPTFQEAEMVENLAAAPYETSKQFPAERLKPLLTPTELQWFVEFYEHNKGPTAIAKKYNVTVDQVKHWRKQTLKKIEIVFSTSELLDLLNE